MIRTLVQLASGSIAALLLASHVTAATPLPTLIDDYCSNCHDGHVEAGEYVEGLDAQNIAGSPFFWSGAERHLRAGTMPPAGAKRPDRRTMDEAATAIEQALDRPAPATDTSPAIATRLASLLWNTEPDKQLLQAAQRDELRDTAFLEREVHRMLADPRAEAFVARFLFPWLQLDKLEKADPDKRFFPDYDPSLRDSMRREAEMFLLSQLRDDHDPVDLWTADYTFVNEQLAKHYGIAGVSGEQFRRVTVPAERAGLLGRGGVLMATSRHQHEVNAGYTSPAVRSVWILTRFLGVSPPGAQPGAPPVRSDLPITGQTRALPDKPCVNCHRNFFPLGYALENFDPIGRWRLSDQVAPIDASGALVDGTPMNGPVDLRKGLMQRPDSFRTTVTERLLVYAAGGPFAAHKGSPETLAAARGILRDKDKVRWSMLIAGAVRNKPIALH